MEYLGSLCCGLSAALHVQLLWTAMIFMSSKQSEGDQLNEYCHFETFRAHCSEGEVILMQTAFYGRKSLGRCVRTNFGFIGCYSNVLEFLDRRCSGRKSCEVEVIEPNFENIRPCNVELKSYLEAEYVCLTVAEASLGNCDVSISTRRPIALPRLTSLTCGSDASPWIMKVPAGQRINITLYQFSPPIPPDVADGSKPLGADTRETAGLHQTPSFGRIREPSASQTISSSPHTATGSLIVQGPLSVRESHVHTTQTNDVEVVLNGPNKHDFLLTFAVVGCQDVVTSPDMIVQYSTERNVAKVVCRNSEQSWRLVCSDRGWHGYVGNCTSQQPHVKASSISNNSHMKVTTAIVAIIVVGVSVAISLCVLILGLLILRRVKGFQGNNCSSAHSCDRFAMEASCTADVSSPKSTYCPHLLSTGQPGLPQQLPPSYAEKISPKAGAKYSGGQPLHHHATHQSLLSYQNCPYSLLQVPQKGDRRCDCGRDYSALYVSSRGYASSCAKDARHGTHTDGGCSTVKTNLFGEGDRSLFPWSDTETDVVESEVDACLDCPSTAQNDKLIDDLQELQDSVTSSFKCTL